MCAAFRPLTRPLLQAVLGEIVLVGTLAAQLYIMPFLEFSENMISISSMSGVLHALECMGSAALQTLRPCLLAAVLWLVLLTGEVAKWGHLSAFQTNVIAGLQMALTSGVAAVVALIVAIGLYTMMKKVGGADMQHLLCSVPRPQEVDAACWWPCCRGDQRC